MQKKVYFLAGAAVIIIAVVVGACWHFQGPKTGVQVGVPSEKEGLSQTEELLNQETGSLSQDISDLEIIAEDENLETLEGDLSAVSGETPLEQELPSTPGIDVGEVESLESELSAELDGISSDLTDLEGLEEDASLDSLDASLSGLAE